VAAACPAAATATAARRCRAPWVAADGPVPAAPVPAHAGEGRGRRASAAGGPAAAAEGTAETVTAAGFRGGRRCSVEGREVVVAGSRSPGAPAMTSCVDCDGGRSSLTTSERYPLEQNISA